MALLERHTQLAELAAAHRDAVGGRGSLVLVTGEAGIGKTALVRQFAELADAPVRWGTCDELIIPRPLGPFREMFSHLAGHADVGAFLDAVLTQLDGYPAAAVAVLEDAHWADQATLDAIRFVGRRIGRRRALLIVTYRDDEVPADQPLRLAIGAVPADDVRRVRLGPLSLDAVKSLTAGTGHDAEQLYAITGGNPFYVTETLADPRSQVPLSVQDAVMARVGRLGAAGRACVELASAVPGAVNLELLEACRVRDGLEEGCRRGVLRTDGNMVTFSHELVRRAVEQSITESRRVVINSRILDVLVEAAADPARLTHHAVRAGRVDAIARYAPQAAGQAAAVGAHVEAFDHCLRALEHADQYTVEELIDLLEAAARTGSDAARFQQAHEPAKQAVELLREHPDRARLGVALCRLAAINWHLGHGQDAQSAADEAVAVLEADVDASGAELGTAYAVQARLAVLDHRPDEAIAWGEKGAQVFEHAGRRVPIGLRVTVGTAALHRDPDDKQLVAALEAAVEAGDIYAATRAYCNLADELTLHMRYAKAHPIIDDGLAYLDSHDELVGLDHLLAIRAHWYLDQGRWTEAVKDARRVLSSPASPSATMARTALGLVQIRRGDPGGYETVTAAHQLAIESAEAQHLIPATLSRAELAWLSGEPAVVGNLLEPVLGDIQRSGLGRWIGEAALWLKRIDRLDAVPPGAARPYELHMAGRWQEAAAAWNALGRPYEMADALADSTEPGPLLEALAILDRMGAEPRAAMIRRQLGELGVDSVPRGPRATTRANPAGLTARQVEVLRLLADDLTYRAIADRLHVSVKTVDRHMTAVRSKLGVASRYDAVEAGRRLGILH